MSLFPALLALACSAPPAAPLRIENGLGFRTMMEAKAFRDYWGSLADEDKLRGKLSDHLTRDQVASAVALEVHIAVAQFIAPTPHTSLDDELQRFLSGGGRFHTGRLPDGFESERPRKAVVLLIHTKDGNYGLITFYSRFVVVELNKRVGVVLDEAANKPEDRKDKGRGSGDPAAGGRLDVQAYFSEDYSAISTRANRADGTTVLHGLQLLLGPKKGLKEYAVYNDGVLEQRYQYYPSGLEFRRQRREHNGEGYEVVLTPERSKVLAEKLIVSGGVDIGPLKVQDEVANGLVKADRRWKGTFLEWERIPNTYGQERLVLREYRDGAAVKSTPYPAEKLGLPPDPHGHKRSTAWPWRWPWRDHAPEWPAAR